MKMLKRLTLFLNKDLITALLWGLIAVYVFMIPDAILVYRYIEKNFGLVFAGRIPAVLVVLLGVAFIIYLRQTKRGLRNLLYLIPSALIVLVIFQSVDNPNKHIHIPEYVILAWLVYAVLSREYDGNGILILVFLCTSLLGVVDELEQGIHPGRTYGWIDMAVNGSSALIGVFTILGLKTIKTGNWKWFQFLREYAGLLWLILFGGVGMGFICYHLFGVQANLGQFQGVYPGWLMGWNVSFLLIAPLMVYLYRRQMQQPEFSLLEVIEPLAAEPAKKTAHLWLLPGLAILFYMHLLVFFASGTGILFK